MAAIATHNGILTVLSVATGDHRTFLIRTQPDDSKFAPGKRTVSLLVGPDNTSDYQAFGFVDERGAYCWRKYANSQYAKLSRMLNNLAQLEASGKIEVSFETKCRRCNRPLTTPQSIASGIGPICEEKAYA